MTLVLSTTLQVQNIISHSMWMQQNHLIPLEIEIANLPNLFIYIKTFRIVAH